MTENKIPALDSTRTACDIGELISGFNATLGGESRGGYTVTISIYALLKIEDYLMCSIEIDGLIGDIKNASSTFTNDTLDSLL